MGSPRTRREEIDRLARAQELDQRRDRGELTYVRDEPDRRPSEKKGPVTLAATGVLRETEKAIRYGLLISGQANPVRMWVPRSQVLKTETMDDGTLLLTVTRWFAAKEGLADE